MNGPQPPDTGVDVVSLRLVVGGLVAGLLLSIAALWTLAFWGVDPPQGLSILTGTLAGSLASLLVRPSRASS